MTYFSNTIRLSAVACIFTAGILLEGATANAALRTGARSVAHTSVNRPAVARPPAAARTPNTARGGTREANRDRSVDVDRTRERNVNRDINRDVNINHNVNVDTDGDYHGHHDHWNDWDDHPFATAAAVTAGVAITSAVIGSIVSSVPPSCVTTVINGIAYQQCGSVWYQPQYSGTTVQYIVVNSPY